MGTIIKSILRFFKTSKIAIIGLFLLIFFSSTIFTLLNSTTTNLERTYSKVANDGNLHDFVINEHYTIGTADYKTKKPPIIDTSLGKERRTYNFTYSTIDDSPGSPISWTGAYLQVYLKLKENHFDQEYIKYEKNFLNFSKTFDENPSYSFEKQVEDFLSIKKIELTNYTNKKIKEFFYDEIKKINYKENNSNKTTNAIENIRLFKSIDLNNNKQNMFFKAVESSYEFNVDKIIYYSGNELSMVNNPYYNIFAIDDKNRQTWLLTQYLAKAKWSNTSSDEYLWIKAFYDFLIEQNHNETNNIFDAYDGTIPSNLDRKIAKGQKIAKEFVDSVVDSEYKGNYSVNNKGFQISFNINKTPPLTMSYDDFTSYEIVVSPYYANVLGKTPIDKNEWNKIINESQNQNDFEKKFSFISTKHKIQIDNMEFVLVGTGISPDFMYPIVSFNNLVPNKELEQIIYVNPSGYQKLYDSNRGSPQEEFIVGTFNKTIPKNKYLDIIKEINDISRSYMAWPENIDAAYLFDDERNVIFPTALRVQFIPQTVEIANVISLFMTSFVLILSIIVSIIVIKRFIENNRNSLGIMQANGYRKKEIILGLNIFIGIPIIISTICGYIIGFLLQGPTLELLGNFWTIPTQLAGFSLLSLIIICFVLFALFVVITTIYSWWALKGETSEFMKDEAKYKMSRVARIMKLPFSKFGVLSRFRAAIAFSSLWRMFILSIMSSLLMVSLTFSFSVLNKFENASQKTFESRNYVYSMNLVTPTLQSGQYYGVPYGAQGMTLIKNRYFYDYDPDDIKPDDPNLNLGNIDKKDIISQDYFNGLKSAYGDEKYKNNKFLNEYNQKYGNYQLVSINDNRDMKNNILYTKNMTSTKTFINFLVGSKFLPNLSANPWTLAESMMPPNNASYANESYNQLLTKAYHDKKSTLNIDIPVNSIINSTNNNNYPSYSDIIRYFTEPDLDVNNLDPSSFKVLYDSENKPLEKDEYRKFKTELILDANPLTPRILPNFLLFLYDLYANDEYKEFSYSINYNKIPINVDEKNFFDEPYSYMDFKIEKINNSNVNLVDNLRAIGFNENTKKVILTNDNNNKINYKLFDSSKKILEQAKNNNEYYPVIINAFAARKYGIEIGSTIDINVLNSTDRYSRKLHGVDNYIQARLKVVDITTTYQGSEFYMSQYDVNKIIGLTINGVSPILPKSKDEITNTINWNQSSDINSLENQGNNTQKLDEKDEFQNWKSGFNGIFTSDYEKLVEVTNGVSIYSPSGLYPATDKFTSPLIKSILDQKDQKVVVEKTLGFPDGYLQSKTSDEIIKTIIDVFGESTAFTILSDATSKDAMLSVFNSVTTTMNDIQKVVLGIIIVVSIIIVVIISGIIINDSMKLAAILKCLGFRNSKNAFTFLTVYCPVLLIGLLIAVPLSFAINSIYINVVFNFAGILLTIPLHVWHFALSIAIIIIIFSISFSITWYRIRNIKLTQAIK